MSELQQRAAENAAAYRRRTARDIFLAQIEPLARLGSELERHARGSGSPRSASTA